MESHLTKTEQEAQRFGIDLSLTNFNLSLTYEQRLANHQRALNLVLELRKAGRQLEELNREKDKATIKELLVIWEQQRENL